MKNVILCKYVELTEYGLISGNFFLSLACSMFGKLLKSKLRSYL